MFLTSLQLVCGPFGLRLIEYIQISSNETIALSNLKIDYTESDCLALRFQDKVLLELTK
jgi:hypothetical protein